jgi:hypothetical protein
METTPAASLNAVTSSPSLDARREEQLGYPLVEEVVYREAPQMRAFRHFAS